MGGVGNGAAEEDSCRDSKLRHGNHDGLGPHDFGIGTTRFGGLTMQFWRSLNHAA